MPPIIGVVALSITRSPGEQLVLTTGAGERIVITIERPAVASTGKRVVVIDAPRSVRVLRGELDSAA